MGAITISRAIGLAQGGRRILAAATLSLGILIPTAACGGYEAPKAAPTPFTYSAPASIPPATPTATPARLTPTPATVTVDLSNYLFTPTILEVEAGKVARFHLVGDGLAHTFTIAAIGVDIPVPEGTKSQVVEFTLAQGTSGDLKLTCAFHELAGMVGTVRVK